MSDGPGPGKRRFPLCFAGALANRVSSWALGHPCALGLQGGLFDFQQGATRRCWEASEEPSANELNIQQCSGELASLPTGSSRPLIASARTSRDWRGSGWLVVIVQQPRQAIDRVALVARVDAAAGLRRRSTGETLQFALIAASRAHEEIITGFRGIGEHPGRWSKQTAEKHWRNSP